MDDFYGDPNNLNLEDGDSSDDDFLPSLHLRYCTICKFLCWYSAVSCIPSNTLHIKLNDEQVKFTFVLIMKY